MDVSMASPVNPRRRRAGVPVSPERHRAKAALMWVALAAMLGSSGCKDRESTPEGSLRAFLANVEAGQAKKAWKSLCRSSQDALLADAKRLAEAEGSKPPSDPAEILFQRGDLTVLAKAESISVSSPLGGDEVLLRVTVEDGDSANIRMVREGAHWKVDLVRSLEPFEQNLPEVETSTPAEDAPPE